MSHLPKCECAGPRGLQNRVSGRTGTIIVWINVLCCGVGATVMLSTKSWKWTNTKNISGVYQVYGIFEEWLVRYKHENTIYLSYTRYIPDIWQHNVIYQVYTRYILYIKSIYQVYTKYKNGINLAYDEVIHIPGLYLLKHF